MDRVCWVKPVHYNGFLGTISTIGLVFLLLSNIAVDPTIYGFGLGLQALLVVVVVALDYV